MDISESDEELSDSPNEDNSTNSSTSSSCSSSGNGASGSSTSSTTSVSSGAVGIGGVVEPQFDSLELAQIGPKDEIFRLPRSLCENVHIFNEFFSLETWQMLPQQMQAQLEDYLPNFSHLLTPEMAAAEQTRTIALLFSKNNRHGLQRFGQTPLNKLQRQLEEGHLRPDVLKLKRNIVKAQRREKRFQNCEQISHLARELFISRERQLRNAYKSAPDSMLYTTRMQRKRQLLELPLQEDNSLCTIRARKRYCAELQDLVKELKLNLDDISADEQDMETDTLTTERCADFGKQTDETTTEEVAAVAKTVTGRKSIYDTFFKRQHGRDDEDVIHEMQETRQMRLSDKNIKQYLRDYKRRKLKEPHLPEFDTTDIRLRDICTRAQFTGVLKPGRRPKAKFTEPPALVPIKTQSNLAEHGQHQPQQHISPQQQRVFESNNSTLIGDEDVNAVLNVTDTDDMDEIELHQEEVITSIPANRLTASNDAHAVTQLIEASHELPQQILKTPERLQMPRLEPITNNGSGICSPVKMNKVKVSPQTTPTTTKPQVLSISPNILMPALMQETHACFFSLLRDLFCATPNHRMRYEELSAKLDVWLANPIAALNDWYNQASNWSTEILQSAINFLTGNFAILPAEYVPYIDHKTQLNIFQWIGASRDSDARLVSLYNFWQQRRQEVGLSLKTNIPTRITAAQTPATMILVGNTSRVANQRECVNIGEDLMSTVASATEQLQQLPYDDDSPGSFTYATPTPPPRCPTNWAVRAASVTEIADFRRQERARFEQPHRAFTYRMHGYESVVGPVKGIYTQILALTKARGHSIMVDDRPNFVTILTLVRDATARLPNGEGTRADISELLKCSQYINPNAAENVLQTIVSGALDRMHAGHDPCVRYDPKRKIWIYLHRNRSESEFERMHQNNQVIGKQKMKSNRKPKFKRVGGSLVVEQMHDSTMQIVVNADTANAKPVTNAVPALVPASIGSSLMVKKNQTLQQKTQPSSTLAQQTLPTKCPPVPPLKYNTPNVSLQQYQQQQQHQQQKSLLKTTVHVQRIAHPDKTQTTQLPTNTRLKQYNLATVQTNKMPIGSTNVRSTATNATAAATTATPIFVSTPTGLQTVHVAASTPNTTQIGGSHVTAPTHISATVGGKKISLAKSIVINQVTQQQQQQQQQQTHKQVKPQQQIGNLIVSHEGRQISIIDANSSGQLINKQQQQQQQAIPKNIIRFVPASTTATSTSPSTRQPVQIVGQRILAQTTVRPVQQQHQQQQQQHQQQQQQHATKNIGTKTLTATTGGGTVVKMSAQAFAALQQKQANVAASGQNLLVKPAIGACSSMQATQRILVGNTAISANKNIVFQPITTATQKITTSTGSQTTANVTTKVLTTPTTGKIQTINTTSLTPQQQRVLFQNLKQQQQQQQQKSANATATTVAAESQAQTQKPTARPVIQRVINISDSKPHGATVTATGSTVVAPSSAQMTRLIRTTNATATNANTSQQQQQQQQQQQLQGATTAAAAGQIITLDNLLQQSKPTRIGNAAATKVMSAGNIIQLVTSSNSNSSSSGGTTTPQYQVVTPPRSIISIGSTAAQHRLITTQAQGNTALVTTPTSVAAVNSKLAAGRLVATSANTKLLGKTTTVNNINLAQLQGKQVVLPTLKNVVRAAGGQNQTLQNVVIGGQTIKVQNAANIQRPGATVMSTSQMQTVLMGNQILRVQPQQSQQQQPQQQARAVVISNAAHASNDVGMLTTTSTTSQTTVPKTFVIGTSGGQTIRLQPAAGGTATAVGTTATTPRNIMVATSGGNACNVKNVASNMLFAVQGGGQILLSPAFQGGTINLKPLQKVVSLPMAKAGSDCKLLPTGSTAQATVTISPKASTATTTVLKTSGGISGMGDGS